MSNWYIETRKEDPTSNQETRFLCHKIRGDVMSDCPLEYEDRRPFLESEPRGFIVVGGLGLGIIIDELLELEKVNHVFVVEIEQEVIDLVASKYDENDRVTIVKADARNFDTSTLPQEPDFIYMDIWDDDLGTSYEDRIEVCKHWGEVCSTCFSWALERSKRHFKRRSQDVGGRSRN